MVVPECNATVQGSYFGIQQRLYLDNVVVFSMNFEALNTGRSTYEEVRKLDNPNY